jgi:hypothetical protein
MTSKFTGSSGMKVTLNAFFRFLRYYAACCFKTDVSGLYKLDSLALEDGTDSPETSVLSQRTPRYSPEDGRIQFSRGGCLRSIVACVYV